MFRPSLLTVLYVLISFGVGTEGKLTEGQLKKPQYQKLPALKEQANLKDGWTKNRVEAIPRLLEKYGVDAWLVSQKEYAEDTMFWSFKPADAFSARRRTTTLFLRDAKSGPSSHTWVNDTPELWRSLRSVLSSEDPSSIALNIDAQIAFSSGLHAGEFSLMIDELGPEWAERIVSKPMLAVEFIGTMPEAQLAWYKKLMEMAWAMISEAFSSSVITPAETTTTDVEWWLREKVQSWNYTTWFHPTISIIAPNSSPPPTNSGLINYGDMLHVDFGVTALGMNTDTQHLAYVPHPNESDVPQGLKDGLKKTNRLQDILKKQMEGGVGKSGNEILKESLDIMQNEGFAGSIYSHPIGDWGHSAGTLIGMTDLPTNVPILGDLPLLNNTYYSIELFAEHFVPEYNETLNFYLEEDVFWDAESGAWEWVYGRQERFYLIRTAEKVEGEEGFMVQELR